VPAVANVYDLDVTALAFVASVAMFVGVRSVTVPAVPVGVVDTWKKLLNEAPVEALPLFVIVALNVVAVPALAEIGVTEPAVRSGVGEHTPFTITSPKGHVVHVG